MKNRLTSRERRGLIAVAATALLTTGAAYWLRSQSRQPEIAMPEKNITADKEIESDTPADSAATQPKGVDSKKGNKKGKEKQDKKRKKRNRKEKRAAASEPPRDPFEPIPAE